MSTTTTPTIMAAPAPLEIPGPIARVPSLDDLYRLTDVPDQRVVFRGVDWAFYEELVDSIPESCKIHVDFDGRDLEILSKGRRHEIYRSLLGRVVDLNTEVFEISCCGAGQTTWKRREISRGIEADQSFYFLPEKIAADVAALMRKSDDIADYPNPDLAIEVDISRPQVNRAGIYAALRVAEVWRFDGGQLIIERLTAEGTYTAVESSGFLPVRAEDVRRWVVDEYTPNHSAWGRRLYAELQRRRAGQRPQT